MTKKIIFCADGTWNGPGHDNENDKSAAPSNVFKLFANLDGRDNAADLRHENEQERALLDDAGTPLQAAKYLHGVGDSDNYLVRLLGGSMGAGLITRILRGYTYVSRNYAAGDEIILVGFSRGAYTARALGGLICAKGVLDAGRQDLSDKEAAYRAAAAVWYEYRRQSMQADNNESWLAKLQQTVVELPGFFSLPATAPRCDVPFIAAVAVWDTVGSLGIPEYARGQDGRIDALQFCSRTLHQKVRKGLHAVSLDERRADFTPTPWDPDPARITQVLFCGAHADVGGGYPMPESGLSDIALAWMMESLRGMGVRFQAAPAFPPRGDALACAHRPWLHSPFDFGRQIERQFSGAFAIHRSVLERCGGGPCIGDVGLAAEKYEPGNVPTERVVVG